MKAGLILVLGVPCAVACFLRGSSHPVVEHGGMRFTTLAGPVDMEIRDHDEDVMNSCARDFQSFRADISSGAPLIDPLDEFFGQFDSENEMNLDGELKVALVEESPEPVPNLMLKNDASSIVRSLETYSLVSPGCQRSMDLWKTMSKRATAVAPNEFLVVRHQWLPRKVTSLRGHKEHHLPHGPHGPRGEHRSQPRGEHSHGHGHGLHGPHHQGHGPHRPHHGQGMGRDGKMDSSDSSDGFWSGVLGMFDSSEDSLSDDSWDTPSSGSSYWEEDVYDDEIGVGFQILVAILTLLFFGGMTYASFVFFSRLVEACIGSRRGGNSRHYPSPPTPSSSSPVVVNGVLTRRAETSSYDYQPLQSNLPNAVVVTGTPVNPPPTAQV